MWKIHLILTIFLLQLESLPQFKSINQATVLAFQWLNSWIFRSFLPAADPPLATAAIHHCPALWRGFHLASRENCQKVTHTLYRLYPERNKARNGKSRFFTTFAIIHGIIIPTVFTVAMSDGISSTPG